MPRLYDQLYRRATVRDRWAAIYGGDTTAAAFMRLQAAGDRLGAELVKAGRIEEAVEWLSARLR